MLQCFNLLFSVKPRAYTHTREVYDKTDYRDRKSVWQIQSEWTEYRSEEEFPASKKMKPPLSGGFCLHCPGYDVSLMITVLIRLCLNNAINWANVHTLVIVEVAFALHTFLGINFENYITFKYGLSGANRFTCSTRNAVI